MAQVVCNCTNNPCTCREKTDQNPENHENKNPRKKKVRKLSDTDLKTTVEKHHDSTSTDAKSNVYDYICGNCGKCYNKPKRFHCLEKDFCTFKCLQKKCDDIREANRQKELERVKKTASLSNFGSGGGSVF